MRGIHLIALSAAVSLGLTSPVLGLESADDTAVDPKSRMICKRAQKTGTRFQTKICKTAAQWDALSEQHKRDLAETVNRPQVEIRRD